MSAQENKALFRRLVDAINNKDSAVLREVLAPDLAKRWTEETIPWLYATWDNHRIEITDMMADDDKVWARLATGGRHTGAWLGMAATGKTFVNTGVYFVQFSGGKVVKVQALFDDRNLAKQLGGTLTVAPS